MNAKANHPIGIFDSGVGGLTVASAIKRILPNENLIYFGDTAHLPYGDKSIETISYYSEHIAEFLLEQQCKIIVIACNSASAVANENVIKHVGESALVINVIDPVVEFIASNKQFSRLGIIGTKATINSGTYEKKIKEKKTKLEIFSMATPLFVPMIEEGFIFDDISNAIIRTYLSKKEVKDIDALVLGCTHYPVIKNQISKFYNFKVDVIDSSKIVASYLHEILQENNLMNNEKKISHKFFISDYTDYFKVIARLFFEEDIPLEKLNFWN